MATLSDIVAQLESGGGTQNASQPPSMVNPTYGQYPGFVKQYGSGAAGVNNFANQILASNPNATLGDFYAAYVLGTGNPSNPPSLTDLANTTVPGAQGAYNNLVNNAGVDPSTSLSSLLSSDNTATVAGDLPDTLSIDPSGGILDFSNASSTPFYTPGTSDVNLGATFGPGGSIDTATGNLGGSSNSPTSFFTNFFASLSDIAIRSGLVLLGIVLVAIGGFAAVRGEGVTETVVKAAAIAK